MKRVSALLLVFLMVFASSAALAAKKKKSEAKYFDLEARSVAVSRETAAFGYQDSKTSLWGLMNSRGEVVLEPTYDKMYTVSDYAFFKVNSQDKEGSVETSGLINAKGEVLVPPQYWDVSVVSDKWQVGIHVVECEADDKEYTSGSSFYKLDSADVYYGGKMVKTLSRAQYGGTPEAWGNYLKVTARDKTQAVYNSKMKKSRFTDDYITEFETKYEGGKTTNIHSGTNKPAFTEGCGLKKEQVKQYWLYADGKVLNLDGSTMFTPKQKYSYINDFRDGYAVVSMNKLYGLVNEAGEELIPLEYDSVGNYEKHPLKYGCISVVKDGKLGFLNSRFEVSCPFVYAKESVTNYATFATVKDLDGTVIVLSGLVGELPEHYKSVSIPSGGSVGFVAENSEKQRALIDIYGETRIPWVDASTIYHNRACTLAIYRAGSGTYRVYRFPAFDPENIPTPENNKAPACPGCGYVFPNGKVTNYCPDCGLKQDK